MEKTLDKTAVEGLKELLPYLMKFLEEESQEAEHKEEMDEETETESMKEIVEGLVPVMEKIIAASSELDDTEASEVSDEEEEEEVEVEEKEEKEKEDEEEAEDEEEEPAEKPVMDSASIKKAIYRDMENRDRLYDKLSRVTGAFSYKAMDSAAVAKYGVKKLGLDCKNGQEMTAINAYLKGVSSVKATVAQRKVAVAQDSFSNKNSPIAKYLRGE